MKYISYSLITLLLILSACSSSQYGVYPNAKLKNIKVNDVASKQGKMVLLKDYQVRYDSIYENSKGVYTIQNINKGKLYSIHGITHELEDYSKEINHLVSKYNLKRLKKRDNIYLSDQHLVYIKPIESHKLITFEYSYDMSIPFVKKIKEKRQRAQQLKQENDLKNKQEEEKEEQIEEHVVTVIRNLHRFVDEHKVTHVKSFSWIPDVKWNLHTSTDHTLTGKGTVEIKFVIKKENRASHPLGQAYITGTFKDGVLISQGTLKVNLKNINSKKALHSITIPAHTTIGPFMDSAISTAKATLYKGYREQKSVGQKVCNELGRTAYVEKTVGNKLQLRGRSRNTIYTGITVNGEYHSGTDTIYNDKIIWDNYDLWEVCE